MPIDCQRSTSGGKGNLNKFLERDPQICGAGIPTGQPDEDTKGALQHYLLKDEVDALIGDAMLPPPKPRPLPPLRHPIPPDNRHGFYTDCHRLLHPPIQTKFQSLVEDFKNSIYSSYWKKQVGKLPDPVPMMPEGFDIYGTTYGKKTPYHGRLYDIVMPKNPYPDKTPDSKRAGVQTNRHYCTPAFNKDLTYGHRTGVDKRGTYARCCVTDDRIVTGNANHSIVSSIQSNYQHVTQPRSGTVLAPNNNIECVPKGYTFGNLKPPDNLPECLTTCEINPGREEFKKCLKCLNTLRKVLKSRFLPTFFHKLYLSLKYFDTENTGWLPKDVVYKYCATKFIRFDTSLIEPLLSMWSAFNGSDIDYKIFVHVINYKERIPDMSKVPDIPDDCLDFNTTYTDMTNPSNKKPDLSRTAGVPSGRYLDLDFPITPDCCCKADRACFPHESDVRSCINPSVMTLLQVNHRDMYEHREPSIVRRVFESAYGKFTDEEFKTYWEEAKKYHSHGWVCFQTFRRAYENIKNPTSMSEEKKGHH